VPMMARTEDSPCSRSQASRPLMISMEEVGL
jgi:hypothetical protein